MNRVAWISRGEEGQVGNRGGDGIGTRKGWQRVGGKGGLGGKREQGGGEEGELALSLIHI